MPRGAHTIQVLGPLATRPARAGGGTRPAAWERELPDLGPRRIGALLDTSFDALRARFATCLALAAPLWFAVHGLQRLLVSSEMVAAPEMADFVLLFGQGAVQSAVRAVTMALVTLVVYGYLQGQAVSATDAVAACARRALGLLVLTFVTGLGMFFAVSCGVVCLFVPAVALSWLWAVAPAALVLEGVGPLEALRRSAVLARRGFPRWAGVMATQWCLTLPFLGVLSVLADPGLRADVRAALGLPEPWFTALDLAFSSVLSGFATALAAVVLTVYYIDRRVRVEGFDLDMGLERLRRRTRPARGGAG